MASHDSIPYEGVGFLNGIEDLFSVVKAAIVGDGIEFSESARRVAVGELGGLDHEGVDLLGFLEVGTEEEERDVCVLADWGFWEGFWGKSVSYREC